MSKLFSCRNAVLDHDNQTNKTRNIVIEETIKANLNFGYNPTELCVHGDYIAIDGGLLICVWD
jgi:hypothetical protein